MKLNCSILVVYRSQSTVGIPRKRAQNSSLNLMLNPKDDKEAFLIHQTVKCNGVKYKITGNIENIFTKFLSLGKATIRLKVPAVDLCIECDSLQLKCFLQKLKAILQGQDAKTLKLMTVSSSTQVPQKPKTKLLIVKKENYNLLCQFPRTLEIVQINNIGASRVDFRILKLCNLRILNLERNAIECLPEAIGSLQICELYLGSNALGKNFHPSHWKWMSGRAIKNSLALLSLEKNQLQYLPKDIVKLKNLVTLKLDNNLLKELPVSIGRLSKLSYFTVSCNKLKWLPSTLRRVPLMHLDLSHNEPPEPSDLSVQDKRVKSEEFFNILSLRDIAALSVLRNRFQYSIQDGDLPITLQDFINEASDCRCGKPSFCSWPFGFIPLYTENWSTNTIQYWGTNHVVSARSIRLFKFNHCSYSCQFNYFPFQLNTPRMVRSSFNNS